VLRCPECAKSTLVMVKYVEKKHVPGYKQWGGIGVYECSNCGHKEVLR